MASPETCAHTVLIKRKTGLGSRSSVSEKASMASASSVGLWPTTRMRALRAEGRRDSELNYAT